jgi:hypothetical protein
MAKRKPREAMTTEQLAEKVLQDVKEMSPDEKAHVRAKLDREFLPKNESPRDKIARQMARYGFTPAMCENKSADQLLHLAAMLVGHRRYLGILEADEIIRLGEMEKAVAEIKRVN